MKEKRFRGLTEHQFQVFGQITIGNDLGHNPRTLNRLEEVGLVTKRPEILRGLPPVKVYRYDVPIAVHAEWCQWCSEQEQIKEKVK